MCTIEFIYFFFFIKACDWFGFPRRMIEFLIFHSHTRALKYLVCSVWFSTRSPTIEYKKKSPTIDNRRIGLGLGYHRIQTYSNLLIMSKNHQHTNKAQRSGSCSTPKCCSSLMLLSLSGITPQPCVLPLVHFWCCLHFLFLNLNPCCLLLWGGKSGYLV